MCCRRLLSLPRTPSRVQSWSARPSTTTCSSTGKQQRHSHSARLRPVQGFPCSDIGKVFCLALSSLWKPLPELHRKHTLRFRYTTHSVSAVRHRSDNILCRSVSQFQYAGFLGAMQDDRQWALVVPNLGRRGTCPYNKVYYGHLARSRNTLYYKGKMEEKCPILGWTGQNHELDVFWTVDLGSTYGVKRRTQSRRHQYTMRSSCVHRVRVSLRSLQRSDRPRRL